MPQIKKFTVAGSKQTKYKVTRPFSGIAATEIPSHDVLCYEGTVVSYKGVEGVQIKSNWRRKKNSEKVHIKI